MYNVYECLLSARHHSECSITLHAWALLNPHNDPMRGDLSNCTRRKRRLCKVIDLPKIRQPRPVDKESTVKRICQSIIFSTSWSSLNCAKEDIKNQHRGKTDSQAPVVFTTPFVHQTHMSTMQQCPPAQGCQVSPRKTLWNFNDTFC